MNKVVIIFAVVFCYFICTISCIETGCYTLEIDNLELVTGKFVETNRYYYLEPSTPENTNEVGFAIRASESHKVCKKPDTSFPLITQTWADAPISKYTSSIDLITITSDDSIIVGDKLFVPESSLNEIIEASIYDNYEDINEFLSNFSRFYRGDQINMRFSKTPDHPLNHQFFFKVIMSDGVIFKLESDTVKTK